MASSSTCLACGGGGGGGGETGIQELVGARAHVLF